MIIIVYTKLNQNRNQVMRYVLNLVVMGYVFLVIKLRSSSPFLFLGHQRMYCQVQVHIIYNVGDACINVIISIN